MCSTLASDLSLLDVIEAQQVVIVSGSVHL